MTSGDDKFKSCRFRSGLVEIGTVSCCSSNLHDGYVCFIRGIEDLDASHCESCSMYQKKIIEKDEESSNE